MVEKGCCWKRRKGSGEKTPLLLADAHMYSAEELRTVYGPHPPQTAGKLLSTSSGCPWRWRRGRGRRGRLSLPTRTVASQPLIEVNLPG